MLDFSGLMAFLRIIAWIALIYVGLVSVGTLVWLVIELIRDRRYKNDTE